MKMLMKLQEMSNQRIMLVLIVKIQRSIAR